MGSTGPLIRPPFYLDPQLPFLTLATIGWHIAMRQCHNVLTVIRTPGIPHRPIFKNRFILLQRVFNQ